MKSTFVVTILFVVLCSAVFPIAIRRVQAAVDITINTDGSISPASAPILHIGNFYELTADIIGSITVLRGNITLDGGHHVLQGGIGIPESPNSVQNMNDTVENFVIQNGVIDAEADALGNVTIRYNQITGEVLISSYVGAFNVIGNNITVGGIDIGHEAPGSFIARNTITASQIGIYLDYLSGSIVSENQIEGCDNGIFMGACDGTVITGNNIANNVNGTVLGLGSSQYGSYASGGNTIEGNNLACNTQYGIVLCGASQNTISNNNITNNMNGICLEDTTSAYGYNNYFPCDQNIIASNNLQINNFALELGNGTSNNTVFHNNFISNTKQATAFSNVTNNLDNGNVDGGNYWSDYVGVDHNGDGFGDTPYVVNANNTDHYPLLKPYPNVLFKDGFETGNFNRWSGTSKTAGEIASVTNIRYYLGKYSAKFTSNGGGGYEYSYCYENVTSSPELYARGYVYVSQSGIAGQNSRLFFIVFRAGSNGLAYAGWKRVNGVTKWCLTIRQGTSYVDILSSASRSLDKWYCIELRWKNGSTNGVAQLWVNGVLVCSATGKNTSSYGNVNIVRFGLAEAYDCSSTTVYCDCCAIGTARIGTAP